MAEETTTGLSSYPWLHTKGVEMWTLTMGSTDCSFCSGVLLTWVLLGFYPFPITDWLWDCGFAGQQSLGACPASVLLNTPALEIWTFCLMLHLEVLASMGKWEKYSTAQSDFYSRGYKKPCVVTDSLVAAKWFWKYWSCSSYTFLFNLPFSFFFV